MIGLYYLYVHREELVAPRPVSAKKGSITLLWGIFQLGAIAVGLLIWSAFPVVLDWLEAGVNYPGIITQYHGWRIAGLELFLLYLAVSSGAIAFLSTRQELAPRLKDWAASAWPPLGTWFMVVLAAWGAGFFVYVISHEIFGVFRVGLAVLSLASLPVVLWSVRPGKNQLGTAASPPEVSLSKLSAPFKGQLANRVLDGSAAWLGGFILLWGVLFSLWGIFPGQNDFFKDVGMVIALFGVVLMLSGWAIMRVAWFPILFLFCGLPWPDQVYSWVAGPLQHLAAAVAVRFLTICNIPSSVAGTKIMMFVNPGERPRVLNVEEACAGLKSLMTFVTLAAGWAFVFMSSRPLWHRLVQTASAVPIAIFCNVMRVSFTGLTDKWWGHEFSEGFAHRFVGLLLLVPAFFLILLVGWVLDNLFIEEADDEEEIVSAADNSNQRGRVAAKPSKVVVPNRPAVALAANGGVRPVKGAPTMVSASSSKPSNTSKERQTTAKPPAANLGPTPARKPATAGFRPPPVSPARPQGAPGQAGATSAASTSSSQAGSPRTAQPVSTSSPQVSAGPPRARSAGVQGGPANTGATAKTVSPAKPSAPRRATEPPVAKPSQNKEGL